MMQILEAGGLSIMRDDLRPADESNPRGYFEWQEIKKLPANPSVIEQAQGRVTKIISMLLPSLPRKHRFRVIFMNRAIDDVVASQRKMRTRVAGQKPDVAVPSRERMSGQRERMLDLLRRTPTVELLEIDYDELLASPLPVLERVADFARVDRDNLDRMLGVIDPSLRHFGEASRLRPVG